MENKKTFKKRKKRDKNKNRKNVCYIYDTGWAKSCTFVIHHIDAVVQEKTKWTSPECSESSRVSQAFRVIIFRDN